MVLCNLLCRHAVHSEGSVPVLVDESHLDVLNHFISALDAEVEILSALKEQHDFLGVI